jgi:hypothetical protein
LFGAAAALSVGGALFGADLVGAASAAFAFVFLAAHVVRATAGSTAGRLLGAGLLLLAAAAASRLWRPVDAVPEPAGARGPGRLWTVASLDGERLTGVLLLLAVTTLVIAVHRLPGGQRSRWPLAAAVGLGLAPLVVAATGLAKEVAGSRWPLPADPLPLLTLVLPGLLAAVLSGLLAAAGTRRARARLILIAGALALEIAIVADVLRVADLWSLVTAVSTPPGKGGAFLVMGSRVSVEEPTLADRLTDLHPWTALLVALAMAGPALLVLGAGRATPDGEPLSPR